MDDARSAIRSTLSEAKSFLAQESPPKLSEADTKANFIEPIIAALGWTGIGVVTREYYVKNSQEFVDYVMSGPSGKLLALEAKPLQSDLTEKNAAQLIQYCAVEGIEWAALTNSRELQFFNTFLKPDLAAKRIFTLDLFAFNDDDEFEVLFNQVWQLSRERLSTPTGARDWLNQRRLDTALRAVLLNPGSPTLRHLRKTLADSEINASAQDLASWFRTHLVPPIVSLAAPERRVHRLPQATATTITKTIQPTEDEGEDDQGKIVESTAPKWAQDWNSPLFDALRSAIEEAWPTTTWRSYQRSWVAEVDGRMFLAVRRRENQLLLGLTLPDNFSSNRVVPVKGEFESRRLTKILHVTSLADIDDELIAIVAAGRLNSPTTHSRGYFGVSLADLVRAGLLRAGTPLILVSRGDQEVTRATLGAAGVIVWEGKEYRSPSDTVFAAARGVKNFNGWFYWHAVLPEGRVRLQDVRARYLDASSADQRQQGDASA